MKRLKTGERNGKVMRKNFSKEDIMALVSDEDVEFIRLQFTDIFGCLKNVAITASQLEKALDNQCMFDGSSIEGFARMALVLFDVRIFPQERMTYM